MNYGQLRQLFSRLPSVGFAPLLSFLVISESAEAFMPSPGRVTRERDSASRTSLRRSLGSSQHRTSISSQPIKATSDRRHLSSALANPGHHSRVSIHLPRRGHPDHGGMTRFVKTRHPVKPSPWLFFYYLLISH